MINLENKPVSARVFKVLHNIGSPSIVRNCLGFWLCILLPIPPAGIIAYKASLAINEYSSFRANIRGLLSLKIKYYIMDKDGAKVNS